jgi:threonine 3-dehydrogenase
MATCLVTGGAGNLACQLTWPLAERFDRIVLLDVADRPVGPTAPNACFERGDLLDGDGLDALFARHAPAAVIHLASLLSGSCEQDRNLAWRVNMDGTFGLFEAALRHGRPTVLFASSVAAFGGDLPAVLGDDTPQWPATLYGVTKMAAERLGCYYHAKHGLDFRCVRLPITVSRHAPPGAASAIASHAFLESARLGRFTFTARPDTPMALIYVRDVLRAIAGLLAAPAVALSRRVYNIAGMTTTPGELATAIRRRLPNAILDFVPDEAVDRVLASWPGEIDDSTARRDWQWRPHWDLERMADDFLAAVAADAKVSR